MNIFIFEVENGNGDTITLRILGTYDTWAVFHTTRMQGLYTSQNEHFTYTYDIVICIRIQHIGCHHQHISYGRMQTLRTSCIRIEYNPFTVLHTSRYTGSAYARRLLARSIRAPVMIYSHKLLLNYSGIQTYSCDYKMFINSSWQARSTTSTVTFSCS